MAFDSIILSAVAAELNAALSGGRVDKIHQPSPLDVVFTIRNNGANYSLLVSAEAQSPRIHLISSRRPNPQTPPNFCMLLRKYLEGGRVIGFQQIDFDRILHINFAAYDGERLTLVAEIMGKHSNIVLINSTMRILGVAKPIGRTKNRYREVLTGREYVPPPSQNKVNPLNISRGDFDKSARERFAQADTAEQVEMASWLMETFTGMSPFAAREIAMRSCGELDQLGEEFLAFFADLKAHRFTPVLISDDAGRTVDFYAFPSLQYPASNQHERSSINALADTYYTSVLPKKALEQAREEFISLISRELQARTNSLKTIRENMVSGEKAERFKQLGELILSQTASVTAEADSAELIDYYDPEGKMVRVDLDPSLNAAENAESYFSKYRKAVSGAEALKDRLVETEREIETLKQSLEKADSVDSPEDARRMLDELILKGLVIRRQEQASTRKEKPEFDGFKISKIISNGWEILVGQNSMANDHLIQRVAKPSDLWLHVKASPSAHVVIRTNGKPSAVPRSVLIAAAEQAVQHSDSKHSSLVPVDYTERRYVRKPKGSAPGKVIYVNEKTLFVTTA